MSADRREGIQFRVRTTCDEAPRWLMAAKQEGYYSVPQWIASLVRARVKELKSVPRRIVFFRKGSFEVRMTRPEVRVERVTGVVTDFFGIYRSIAPPCPWHQVVHLPTRIELLGFPLHRDCRAFVRALMQLHIPWEDSEPEKLKGPDTHKLAEVFRIFEQSRGGSR